MVKNVQIRHLVEGTVRTEAKRLDEDVLPLFEILSPVLLFYKHAFLVEINGLYSSRCSVSRLNTDNV